MGLALVQRVPILRVFWDLEKTVLHEICVIGTVLWSPTNANSPTYNLHVHEPKNSGSGSRGSDFRVSGGPPVPYSREY